ncbi:MAG: hypothetical protein M3O50_12220 [Myxococcota bacterium]|nr:hypothetical protein [Myxococcota bacterium]
MAAVAWVLNLDADLELGAARGYEPKKNVRLAMQAHGVQLAGALLGAGDVLVDERAPEGSAAGLLGRAFCPTPRAIALLRRAGADPEPGPALDILRRVNSRAFASALGMTLPGAAFVIDLEVARAILRGQPPLGTGWRVKHAFGMAGRNQRVVVPGALAKRDAAFIEAGLARGGVQVEPNVVIESEYAIHGLIVEDGSFQLGAPVRQWCDRNGAWIASERIDPAEALGDHSVREILVALRAEAQHVARALVGAEFFGPFGVDAYSYRGADGALCFQPRSDINARYSMGFATGFGPPPPTRAL